MWASGTAAAIGRSGDVYYRDRARTARMDALLGQVAKPGGLAFDIGAHLGDRTAALRRLGARVVAVEPQPALFRALRLLYGREEGVRLVAAAAGAAPGTASMHLNITNPSVSTLSPAFVAAARTAPGWREQVWDRRVEVPVTTLDRLIAEHGRPDFVKIDVEGAEDAVLSGLSIPVPVLSFEVTVMRRDVARACLDRLRALGDYETNLALGEEHRLRHESWLAPLEMAERIGALRETDNSGDVYARLCRR